ncbi:MAG TPA: C4-dicarboxylate ABC transporter substrate-binding protein [Deltaproteobacteria bacterium]|nr:C4-dicarboxylate ABC transporter substrate-binding protein [Deltaproteobacteria bacterium]
MKNSIALVIICVVALIAGNAMASPYTGKNIRAKMASEEIEGDFMTVWARNFSDHMKEWSGGKIQIDVYPYGTLGATGDINELAQMGIVQFVFSDHAWISSFVPQAQALALNYLFPTERVPEVLDWMARDGEFLPLLEEAFRQRNMVPVAVMFEGWQWVSSKKKIKSLDDMRGLKLRVMSSKLLVEAYKAYGAAPTPMTYGEVYSGLQMGLIDAQVNPLFAAQSMKFYEVQDYFVQLKSEPFIGIPTANRDFFDKLPQDVKNEMRRFWIDAIIPAGRWIEKRNASDMKKMKEAKPSLTFNMLDKEAIDEFKAQAKTVYPLYIEIGGKNSKKILEALQRDISKAKKALNIK